MIRKNGIFIAMGLGLAILAGCSHGQVEKDLNQKISKSDVNPKNEDLRAKARAVIENDTTLTAEQKAKLLDLQDRTASKSKSLADESFKLKDLLISDLSQSQYNPHEIDAIKKRLKKVERERLDNLFGAIDEVNRILGREERPNRTAIMGSFGGMSGYD